MMDSGIIKLFFHAGIDTEASYLLVMMEEKN